MTSQVVALLKQHNIKNDFKNIKAVFFKFGTSNVHHKRNGMTDNYFVAIAILLAPVSFCENPKIPICNLLKSLAQNTHGSHCLNFPH